MSTAKRILLLETIAPCSKIRPKKPVDSFLGENMEQRTSLCKVKLPELIIVDHFFIRPVGKLKARERMIFKIMARRDLIELSYTAAVER